MAEIRKVLPDGKIGVFSDKQSQEEINFLIEQKYPDFRVLPNGKYAKFHPDQSEYDRDNLIIKEFPSYKPNAKIEELDNGQLTTLLNAFGQNWGSEAYASVMAGISSLESEADFYKSYDKYRAEFQSIVDKYRKENPKMALATEIGGTVATLPLVALTKLPKVLKFLPQAWKTLPNSVKATIASAIAGGTWGLGEDESRIESGKNGFLFGAGGGAISYGVMSKAAQFWFKRAKNQPTLQSYKNARDEAYKQVDDQLLGIFNDGDLSRMVALAKNKLNSFSSFYNKKLDKVTNEMLVDFNTKINTLKATGSKATLKEIEQIRQNLYKRYNSSKEEGILEIIDAVDEVIETFPLQHQLITNARESHKVFKRMETLEIALNKAKEKGGDTGKHYKKAIQSILDSPRAKINFTNKQLLAMEAFVNAKHSKFWSKQLAKFSPDTNSFMKFMHFFSAAHDPRTVVLTGATMAAKRAEKARLQEAVDIVKAQIDPVNFMGSYIPSTVGVSTGVGEHGANVYDETGSFRERYIPGAPF